jgi:saccharopine dehydrogenase-like NADP-dependent oxidoreductase
MPEETYTAVHSCQEVGYRVLLIGGYGFFGRKLAERLALDRLLEIVIAGRDFLAAQRCAATLNQEAKTERFSALALDVTDPALYESILASDANVVIHASGPFQDQGYEVARACVRAGTHYIDLADASSFVSGIALINEEAINAKVLVISGASSVPALSSAVVDALSDDFRSMHSIDISISPGNRTERGLATVKAILGYCGAPFQQWCQGQWQQVFGWQNLRRRTYMAPVYGRWLANCDVPDLTLFPVRYAGVRSVRFQAGLELPLLHFGLWLMAGMRRAGIVGSWARYANVLKKLSDWFIGFGSDASAMHVEIEGIHQDGREVRRRWTLIAKDGDGPYVPTLASAILVSKLARDKIQYRGACPCMGLLTLADFSDAMSGLAITMETTQV